MESPGRKVLYEIRHHASLPYVPRYPPLPQADGTNSKGGLRSLVSIKGVSQLKEKWSEYWNPKKTNKPVSLFISPRGELVAVTSGNHVTILRKDDDYRKPCGNFTSYQVHLLLEYGPKNMMFLVLWMIVRPSFSSELMAKK